MIAARSIRPGAFSGLRPSWQILSILYTVQAFAIRKASSNRFLRSFIPCLNQLCIISHYWWHLHLNCIFVFIFLLLFSVFMCCKPNCALRDKIQDTRFQFSSIFMFIQNNKTKDHSQSDFWSDLTTHNKSGADLFGFENWIYTLLFISISITSSSGDSRHPHITLVNLTTHLKSNQI